MSLAFDTLQKKTIQQVLEWYEFQAEILRREKGRVLDACLQRTVPMDPRFVGKSGDEIEVFFDEHKKELDFLAMLDLMAAAEAALRWDYLHRNARRPKAVSKHFRNIRKKKRNDKVRLEEDILDTWISLDPSAKGPAGDFKGALALRDWLAHGRYWNPRLARREYSPQDVYDISDNLLRAISSYDQPAGLQKFPQ